MNVIYIANARIPTEKAHGLQIVKMCEAFSQERCEVKLIVPFRRQSAGMREVKSIWEYYEVKTPFSIKRLPSPDFIPLNKVLPSRFSVMLYMLQSLIFGLMALFVTTKAQGVYYTRDWYTLLVLGLTRRWHGKKIFFEAHEMHGASHSKLLRWLLRRIDGLIVITQALHAYYEQRGMAAEKIIVAADGIDERRLTQQIPKEDARKQLRLLLDKRIICYTGHLFRWKGVYTLAEAMNALPENSWLYVVGGMEEDRQALQQYIHEKGLLRITLVGHVPYYVVPLYLAAADVLVLPNSATASISRECTSPLKLFEYMAAQRPIVASDLPSLREVLRHQEHAYLVAPDAPQALAEGIRAVLQDSKLSEKIAVAAYAEVQHFTWRKRAEKIQAFFCEKSL